MLEYILERDSSLTLAMKLLMNLIEDEVVETEIFYWNACGSDETMPNFWMKPTNLQVEWYRDDPARAGFCNQEISGTDAISLLEIVREDYDLWRDGK